MIPALKNLHCNMLCYYISKATQCPRKAKTSTQSGSMVLLLQCHTRIWKSQVWIPILWWKLVGDPGPVTDFQPNLPHRVIESIKWTIYPCHLCKEALSVAVANATGHFNTPPAPPIGLNLKIPFSFLKNRIWFHTEPHTAKDPQFVDPNTFIGINIDKI